MAEADRLTVAVGEVHVADVSAAGAERGGVRDLLDVHVEQVAEQLHVADLARLEELGSVELAVEEIRLVAVERLVEQRHAVAGGVGAEIGERLGEPGQRLIAGDVPLGLTLHRTDDRGGLEFAAHVDDRTDELAGLGADRGVGVGQVPLMDEPAAARAEGCGREAMLLQEGVERRAVNRSGGRSEDLNRVEAQLRGGGRGGGEAVPIHERSALSLGDERNRDRRFNHKGTLPFP